MQIGSNLPTGEARHLHPCGCHRAQATASPAPAADVADIATCRERPPSQVSGAQVAAVARESHEMATNVASAAAGQPAVAAAVRPPSSDMTETLKERLGPNPFHISAERAGQLAEELGISKSQLMVELIPVAKSYARPPISHYNVGAVGLGKSGDLYLGVNLEFGGQALNQTVHGEQFVTANAMAHGEAGLEALAISAEPCGHCRQFLNELEGGSDLEILIPDKQPVKLSELLPRSFGPGDLGLEAGLLAHPHEALELATEPGDSVERALAGAALQAANRSYAPYSKNPSGVAILAEGGTIYSGSYAENAAFNPSLSPLQAALVHMATDGRQWSDIREVALVEKEGSQASQVDATRGVLGRIAPEASLQVFFAGTE